MLTENMNNLIADGRGLDIVKRYLHAIEMQDLGALKRLMSPDVELIHANYPPVHGREAVTEMIRGYLAIVAGVEFDIRTAMGREGYYMVEKVNVAAAPNGTTARIHVVTVLEAAEDNLLTAIRIYADTSDLFRKFEIAKPQRN